MSVSPRIQITVIAFDRPEALGLLLSSLGRVRNPFGEGVTLRISIDGGGSAECARLAEDFEWRHGRKEVARHGERMGLREHILRETDRVEEVEGLVVLEDDLSVSPALLEWCAAALEGLGEEEEIGQFALYAPRLNEFNGLPFEPLRKDADVWYARVPCSWGQMWTPRQWKGFREWLGGRESVGFPEELHPAAGWKEPTWKRAFFAYLLETGKWVCYPYASLTTNHGFKGVHMERTFRGYEVPLCAGCGRPRLAPPGPEVSCYDEWLEPVADSLPLEGVEAGEVTVDLAGTRPKGSVRTRYLLSRRPCARPLRRFGVVHYPLENNLHLGCPAEQGDGEIHLGLAEDFGEMDGPSGWYESRLPPRVMRGVFQRGYDQGRGEARVEHAYRIGAWMLGCIGRRPPC